MSEKAHDVVVRPAAEETDRVHQPKTFDFCLDAWPFGPVADQHEPEAGVPLDVRQSYLGHASPATSAIYDKAGARRRQREVAKLFSV